MLKSFPVLAVVAFFTLAACNEPTNSQQATAVTSSATNEKFGLDKIKLPPGYHINLYAEVPDARSLCMGTKGTLFVGNRGGGSVYAVVDSDHNGVAEKVYTVTSGLNTPCGVAFKNGSLYVAEINRILRFDSIESMLDHPSAFKVVYDKLPTDGLHGWKFIAFGPDGKLYVPVGAPCNVCDEKDPVYASITRMNADGSGFEIYARGIRNTVGFAWNPSTNELWFTDNGRDNMGDNIPEDELNIAPRAGMHFGFPYCHQGDITDPEYGSGKNCLSYTAPVLKLGPHVAALGMRFYTGKMFPADMQNQVIIAEHGSWNRTKPIGYRLMLVKMENNKPVSYTPFATGWLSEDGKVTGRPVDVQVAPDGAVFVSDDKAGAIYRITYMGENK
jgi:glucose/arabinose dehydrogenase